jgi:hypothetical protein
MDFYIYASALISSATRLIFIVAKNENVSKILCRKYETHFYSLHFSASLTAFEGVGIAQLV